MFKPTTLVILSLLPCLCSAQGRPPSRAGCNTIAQLFEKPATGVRTLEETCQAVREESLKTMDQAGRIKAIEELKLREHQIATEDRLKAFEALALRVKTLEETIGRTATDIRRVWVL